MVGDSLAGCDEAIILAMDFNFPDAYFTGYADRNGFSEYSFTDTWHLRCTVYSC